MGIDSEKVYRYRLEARGYELDSYGHVNNSVYLNYMEQARWSLIREAGLMDRLVNSGKKIVVVETNIRYMKEIRLFDQVIVETRVKIEKPYLVFKHRLLSESSRPFARSTVKTIFLDELSSPVDIPSEFFNVNPEK
jgi:acyl-CoA thioester hydrolase